MKNNNIRTQTTASSGRRGGICGHGHQGRGGRGGHGGRGRVTITRNDYWEVTGLNGRTIKVYPEYRFENDHLFNIPEETWLQLTHMRKFYQSQNQQSTNTGSGINSKCQQQRNFQQTH